MTPLNVIVVTDQPISSKKPIQMAVAKWQSLNENKFSEAFVSQEDITKEYLRLFESDGLFMQDIFSFLENRGFQLSRDQSLRNKPRDPGRFFVGLGGDIEAILRYRNPNERFRYWEWIGSWTPFYRLGSRKSDSIISCVEIDFGQMELSVSQRRKREMENYTDTTVRSNLESIFSAMLEYSKAITEWQNGLSEQFSSWNAYASSNRKLDETRRFFFTTNNPSFELPPPGMSSVDEWLNNCPAITCDAILMDNEWISGLDHSKNKYKEPDRLNEWNLKAGEIIKSLGKNLNMSAITLYQ